MKITPVKTDENFNVLKDYPVVIVENCKGRTREIESTEYYSDNEKNFRVKIDIKAFSLKNETETFTLQKK